MELMNLVQFQLYYNEFISKVQSALFRTSYGYNSIIAHKTAPDKKPTNNPSFIAEWTAHKSTASTMSSVRFMSQTIPS